MELGRIGRDGGGWDGNKKTIPKSILEMNSSKPTILGSLTNYQFHQQLIKMVNVLMWGRFFPVYRKFHWKGEIWPAWLLNNNFSNGPLEKTTRRFQSREDNRLSWGAKYSAGQTPAMQDLLQIFVSVCNVVNGQNASDTADEASSEHFAG